MITVEIIINRPIKDVWDYFTTASHWSQWYGGGIEKAEWKEGGVIIWEIGGPSQISACKHLKLITISGYWIDTAYHFYSCREGTRVVIEEGSPKRGASYSDGGHSQTINLKNSLAKLKSNIETLIEIKPSRKKDSPEKTPLSKRNSMMKHILSILKNLFKDTK